MISIVIASRVEQYLQKTIDDLLEKAEGDIEVIVVLDGYWPKTLLKNDPRVVILHQGTLHDNLGMRAAINAGIAIAKGEYVMKVDEHVMMSPGYDVRLAETCQDDWLVVPRRYRLDAEKWEMIKDGRNPIDYMRVEYPFVKPLDKTQGLHGAEDKERFADRRHIKVDDLMTMQGSLWFIKKDYFNKLFPNGLDDVNYGTFTMEAQELSCTVWLSGGRVVVDKGCWYAHLHKGSGGTGYGFSREQWKRHAESMEKGRLYAINYWLNTTDFKYDWDWLLKKFDMPRGWTENWKNDVIEGMKTDYSTLNYENDEWLSNLRRKQDAAKG